MPDVSQYLGSAAISQENRLIKLSTPLGANVLLPQRVIAHEKLGRSYQYTVDCLSLRRDIELKKLIAQPVTLWLRQGDSSYLPVHGYVHTIKKLGSDGQFIVCQLSFAPWLDFLKFRKDARIWQGKRADDILRDVFNAHPQARGNYRFRLSSVRTTARERSYCVQYETDWNFVQRLMEEEGWFSYHEQDPGGTGHTLVITDDTYGLPPLNPEAISFHRSGTGDEVDKIVQWSGSRTLSSSQLKPTDISGWCVWADLNLTATSTGACRLAGKVRRELSTKTGKGMILEKIDMALLPGSQTPKPPASQTQS